MPKKNVKVTEIYNVNKAKSTLIPLLESRISAGFPSAAENYLNGFLDLNELLIKHPAATYFIKVKGNSMINAGIHSDDILIVDRALSVSNNKIIIARLHDELTVKRVKIEDNKLYLMPDNDEYSPLEVKNDMDFEVWGVVIYVIHKV